ncbi:undecaprenyl pyrophosphate synthetase [Candidatus Termititenax persephonae]|uniref:Isoprenyl transferase n=1 Tax=Candidatus Termititenax persephonae TaxID=2218525 RepID=A0A388TIH9_9BACT|nr:undecaprenyl pyrophosphate synthetase [Candidatus Termititenax persephonae]
MGIWTDIQRHQLRQGLIPRHVAIIMDGNGTWARRRGLPRTAGHARGAEALRRAATEAATLGIQYLSVYAFSTENWKRPPEEVAYLMKLFGQSLREKVPELVEQQIAIRFLGNLKKFSPTLQKLMRRAEQKTSRPAPRLTVNVLINYGGRAEIIRAIQKSKNKKVSAATFAQYLYTAGLPDPDLLIRTSGQLRLSNFLLWQSAYTEFWFTQKCWPDFNGRLFRQAVRDFQKRQRRQGGLA